MTGCYRTDSQPAITSSGPHNSNQEEIQNKIDHAPEFLLKEISSFVKKPVDQITPDDLSKITSLTISNQKDEKYDLSLIAYLNNLESLVINHIKYKDLNFLENMSWLKHFRIYGFEKQDLPNFDYFPHLKSLTLSDGDLTDLGVLKNVVITLNNLDISRNQITDISPVEKFKDLSFLSVSGNPIQSINVVSKLPKLRRLELQNTPIDNIDVLKDCQELQHLDIQGTRVKNLEPIKSCSKLKLIDIRETPVSSIQPLIHLDHLQIVEVTKKNIKDLDLLPNTVTVSENTELAY